ncbi:MAG: DegV family protein [Chloroflexota bacterium]
MSKVRIVTDSNVWMPPDVIEKHQIQVIPHQLKVGDDICLEDAEFTCDELFDRLTSSDPIDKTYLPSIRPIDISQMLTYYQELGSDASSIVSIHMSSELSPMWADARRASEILKGRQTIRVIDSMSTSFGLGVLVQKAAEAAEAGANINEIARIINGAVPHLYFTSFVESLNYLERSEQISASQNLLGTLLGIKGMLIMEEGILQPLEKVQTFEEVVEKLYEFVVEFASVEAVGIIEHQYAPVADSLIERLNEDSRLSQVAIHRINYSPSLAVHLGPKMLGVLVYEGEF